MRKIETDPIREEWFICPMTSRVISEAICKVCRRALPPACEGCKDGNEQEI